MSLIRAAVAGLTAAGTVTSVHQLIKDKVKQAPRIDLLGEKAIKKLYRKANLKTPSHKAAYRGSIATAILGNTALYSLVAIGGKKFAFLKGALVGTAIGLKSAFLPQKIGLGKKYSNRSKPTAAMTIGLYFLGGMAAAGALVLMSKLGRKKATPDQLSETESVYAQDSVNTASVSSTPAERTNVVATA